MATVNSNAIFPSVKFISTDGSGDLQEVVAEPAVSAKKIHDGVTYTAVASGADGNDVSIEIVEDNNASGLVFSAIESAVTLTAESADAVSASLTQEGVTYSADTGGVAGNSITLEIKQGQSGAGVTGIEFSISGTDIVMSAELALENYTQGDVVTALNSAPQAVQDLINASAENSGTSLTNAGTLSATNLSGGVDAVTIASYTQGDVQTAFAGADSSVTDVISVSTENASSSLVSTLVAENLSGGTDEVASDLEADAKYVMIKQSDLHDLDDTEVGDGRKLVWGFVHKASEVFAGLSDPPENFTVTKGALQPINQNTAIRQSYTVQATYDISPLDLKAEA